MSEASSRRRAIIVGVACLLVILAVALAGARWWPSWRAAEASPVVRAFLERALLGDSLGLAALSADPEPVQVALALQREAPTELRTLARTMELRHVVRSGDTLVASYTSGARFCPLEFPEPDLQVQLRKEAGGWRIVYLGAVC